MKVKHLKVRSKAIWMLLYSLLASFIPVQFVLGLFGLSFTPMLGNIWLFCLVFILFAHLWFLFLNGKDFRWSYIFRGILSFLLTLFLEFMVFFVISYSHDSSFPISIEYSVNGNEIILHKGFLLDAFDEHHDLLNPYIMKTEVKRVRYID